MADQLQLQSFRGYKGRREEEGQGEHLLARNLTRRAHIG